MWRYDPVLQTWTEPQSVHQGHSEKPFWHRNVVLMCSTHHRQHKAAAKRASEALKPVAKKTSIVCELNTFVDYYLNEELSCRSRLTRLGIWIIWRARVTYVSKIDESRAREIWRVWWIGEIWREWWYSMKPVSQADRHLVKWFAKQNRMISGLGSAISVRLFDILWLEYLQVNDFWRFDEIWRDLERIRLATDDRCSEHPGSRPFRNTLGSGCAWVVSVVSTTLFLALKRSEFDQKWKLWEISGFGEIWRESSWSQNANYLAKSVLAEM